TRGGRDRDRLRALDELGERRGRGHPVLGRDGRRQFPVGVVDAGQLGDGAAPGEVARVHPAHPTGARQAEPDPPHGASSVVTRSSMRRWMASASSSQPKTQTVAMPSNSRSFNAPKNSAQSTSPLPISLCWWMRASTPGGLMMYRLPTLARWLKQSATCTCCSFP